MSPQFAAGLTGLAGLCMVAGWVTAFRNRAYLGWLGFAFLCLSGFLWTGNRARDLGVPDNRQIANLIDSHKAGANAIFQIVRPLSNLVADCDDLTFQRGGIIQMIKKSLIVKIGIVDLISPQTGMF